MEGFVGREAARVADVASRQVRSGARGAVRSADCLPETGAAGA